MQDVNKANRSKFQNRSTRIISWVLIIWGIIHTIGAMVTSGGESTGIGAFLIFVGVILRVISKPKKVAKIDSKEV